jgi:hypothetical protein
MEESAVIRLIDLFAHAPMGGLAIDVKQIWEDVLENRV